MPVSARLADLRARLAALQPRETALLAILAACAACWWAFGAYEGARLAHATATEARATHIAAQDRARLLGDARLRRAVADEIGRVRMSTLSGPTPEIAQLQLQAELERAARRAGIVNPRVAIEPPAEGDGAFRTVALTVEGEQDATALMALLADIARLQPSVRPTAIEVANSQTSPRVALTVEALYAAPGQLR